MSANAQNVPSSERAGSASPPSSPLPKGWQVAPRLVGEFPKRWLTLWVAGRPVTQGSMVVGRGGGVHHSSSAALKSWREMIGWAAKVETQGQPLSTSPLGVTMTFYLQRPASVPKKRFHPAVRPDLDKLARAADDALTGVVWNDDSQIVSLELHKVYADKTQPTGVLITVRELA